MYTRSVEKDIKEQIATYIATPHSPLHIVIATVAFRMGIDVPGVRNIIHFGSPEDKETYVQEVEHAGRDGKCAHAVLLTWKKGHQHIDKQMQDYCSNTTNAVVTCYSMTLTNIKGLPLIVCLCCDVCSQQCNCGKSQDILPSLLL